MASRRSRRLWLKRRHTPRWAIFWSWIVSAAVWLWIVYRFIVQDVLETSVLGNAGAELFLNGLFFVVVATVMAAFTMFLVRLIGRAWLKLRG